MSLHVALSQDSIRCGERLAGAIAVDPLPHGSSLRITLVLEKTLGVAQHSFGSKDIKLPSGSRETSFALRLPWWPTSYPQRDLDAPFSMRWFLRVERRVGSKTVESQESELTLLPPAAALPAPRIRKRAEMPQVRPLLEEVASLDSVPQVASGSLDIREHGQLTWSLERGRARLDRGGDTFFLADERRTLAVQLSRSTRRSNTPSWWDKLLGREPPEEHLLHAELRSRELGRLRLSSVVRNPNLLEGISHLDTSGHEVPEADLRRFLYAMRNLDCRIMGGDGGRGQQARPEHLKRHPLEGLRDIADFSRRLKGHSPVLHLLVRTLQQAEFQRHAADSPSAYLGAIEGPLAVCPGMGFTVATAFIPDRRVEVVRVLWRLEAVFRAYDSSDASTMLPAGVLVEREMPRDVGVVEPLSPHWLSCRLQLPESFAPVPRLTSASESWSLDWLVRVAVFLADDALIMRSFQLGVIPLHVTYAS